MQIQQHNSNEKVALSFCWDGLPNRVRLEYEKADTAVCIPVQAQTQPCHAEPLSDTSPQQFNGHPEDGETSALHMTHYTLICVPTCDCLL